MRILICLLLLLALTIIGCKKEETTDNPASDVLKENSGYKVAARIKDHGPTNSVHGFQTWDISLTPDDRLHWSYQLSFFGNPTPKESYRMSFNPATGDSVAYSLGYKNSKYQPFSNVLYNYSGGEGSVIISFGGDVSLSTGESALAGSKAAIAYNGDILVYGYSDRGVNNQHKACWAIYGYDIRNDVKKYFIEEQCIGAEDPNGTWVAGITEVINDTGGMVSFACKYTMLYVMNEQGELLDSVVPSTPGFGQANIMRIKTTLDESKIVLAIAQDHEVGTYLYDKQTRQITRVAFNDNIPGAYSIETNWDMDDAGNIYYLQYDNATDKTGVQLYKTDAGGTSPVGIKNFTQNGVEIENLYVRSNRVFVTTKDWVVFEAQL